MTELGRMSFFGHGTKQSYTDARVQFEKAAALGDPSAIKNLGFMFHTGRGVKADVQQAISYYKKAPDHPTVMNNMAMLYRHGQGVPQDSARAVRMFEQAILGGDESAMANLADHARERRRRAEGPRQGAHAVPDGGSARRSDRQAGRGKAEVSGLLERALLRELLPLGDLGLEMLPRASPAGRP